MRQSLIGKGLSRWGFGSCGDFLTGLEVCLAILGWLQFGRGRIVQGWGGEFSVLGHFLEAVGAGLLAAVAGRLSSLSAAYGLP